MKLNNEIKIIYEKIPIQTKFEHIIMWMPAVGDKKFIVFCANTKTFSLNKL